MDKVQWCLIILCDNIFELIQNEFCGEGDMEPLQYGENLEVILSQNIEKKNEEKKIISLKCKNWFLK